MARSIATILPAAVAAASLTACVDTGSESIVILQNQAPISGCSVGASVEDAYRPAGVIEASTRQGYVLTPVVKSYVTATVGEEFRRIAFVHGARVDVEFLDAGLISDEQAQQLRADGLTRFETPFSAMIEPGGTTSMIFEVVPADLINDVIAPLLTAERDEVLVRARVRVFGRIGDDDFESSEFLYPVTVCDECLAINLGACSALSTNYVPRETGGVCNPAQDEAVECCEDPAGQLICPAIGTMEAVN